MKNFFLGLVSLILLGQPVVSQTTGSFNKTISWTNSAGTQTRTTRMFVPITYDPAYAYKLIIALHGGGDNPSNYMEGVKFYSTNSYFGRVIVACPSEGTANTSWFVSNEDFGLVSGIIANLSSTYNIDADHVFLQGFSFGGKSAYLHGLNEASLLRGIIAISPGFYSSADVNNTCTDPVQCQFDFAYENAPLVAVCITAGSGEYNLGQTEPYLDLAKKAVIKLNTLGGNALFIEDPTGYHNLPPLPIQKTCWNHVNQPTAGQTFPDLHNQEISVLYQPAAGTFRLTLPAPVAKTAAISIHNLQGGRVQALQLSSSDDSSLEINLQGSPAGIYFARISSPGDTWVAKLVVW